MANYLCITAISLLVLTACGTAQEEATDLAGKEAEQLPSYAPPASPPDNVVAWVDGLNVRDRPTTAGKFIASAAAGTVWEPTGARSPQQETITLRGRDFTDHWVEVRDPQGSVTGWVFGGAVLPQGMVANGRIDALNREAGCPTEENPGNCGCTFRTQLGEDGEAVLQTGSTYACMTINGATTQLDGQTPSAPGSALDLDFSNGNYRISVTGEKDLSRRVEVGTPYSAFLQVADSTGYLLAQLPVSGECGC